MAFEDLTLNDLMGSIRQQQKPEVNYKPQMNEPTFDEMLENIIPEEPQPLDLDLCIQEVAERLAACRLSEQDMQHIQEFLTLHVQVRQSPSARREAKRAYSNLILYCEEKESIRQKEREKIREKKLAHGQKEGSDSNGIDNEVYDSQAAEGILSMLDYLISLGNQENEQTTEEDTLPEENYDFDNAYAEYLNDTDDGLYEDDADEEDEYFGMSM